MNNSLQCEHVAVNLPCGPEKWGEMRWCTYQFSRCHIAEQVIAHAISQERPNLLIAMVEAVDELRGGGHCLYNCVCAGLPF